MENFIHCRVSLEIYLGNEKIKPLYSISFKKEQKQFTFIILTVLTVRISEDVNIRAILSAI